MSTFRPFLPSTSFASLVAGAALVLASFLPLGRLTADEEVVLVGRLVSAQGAALAPGDVDGTLDEWSPSAIDVSLVTLAEEGVGGFRIVLDAPEAETQRLLVLTSSSRGPGGAGARLDLSRLDAGTHDLGEVRLAPPPVLAAGRVIGPDGQALARARVRLDRRWMGPRAGPPAWKAVGVDARTDREGRYALRAWVGTDELRVEARASGFTPVRRACRAGASAVDLALFASGAIRGRVWLDAACGRNAVEVECVRRDPAPALEAGLPAPIDGDFVVPGLEPGTYDLRLRARDDRDALVTVEGILVRSGQETLDARVANLDLRGRLACLRVRLELPPGAESPFVCVHVRASTATEYHARSERESFELVTSAPSLDVVIDAPGWRLERLQGLSSDRTVLLRPGLPVRLALVGGLPALPTGFALRADLEPLELELTRYGSRGVDFDARGAALVRTSEPGPHAVRIRVRRNASGEEFGLPPSALTPATLEVVEGAQPGEQLLALELDGGALTRLLEELSDEHAR